MTSQPARGAPKSPKRRSTTSSRLNMSVAVYATLLVSVLAASALVGAGQVANGSANDDQRAQLPARLTLEEELNSIVRQHDTAERNDKKLAEALISKILVDGLAADANQEAEATLTPSSQADATGESVYGEQLGSQSMFSAPDWRFRQWLSANDAGNMMMPFPNLPNGPVSTIKRAAKLAAKNHQRLNYGRPTYDFGLGKRPDLAASSLSARYGDQTSSLLQPVGQFGKRPSAHRYDFGLGKRVASPTYPRYDFGLGKRAPNYVRYDFGLGR